MREFPIDIAKQTYSFPFWDTINIDIGVQNFNIPIETFYKKEKEKNVIYVKFDYDLFTERRNKCAFVAWVQSYPYIKENPTLHDFYIDNIEYFIEYEQIELFLVKGFKVKNEEIILDRFVADEQDRIPKKMQDVLDRIPIEEEKIYMDIYEILSSIYSINTTDLNILALNRIEGIIENYTNFSAFLWFHFAVYSGEDIDFIHNLVKITNDKWKKDTIRNFKKKKQIVSWIKEVAQKNGFGLFDFIRRFKLNVNLKYFNLSEDEFEIVKRHSLESRYFNKEKKWNIYHYTNAWITFNSHKLLSEYNLSTHSKQTFKKEVEELIIKYNLDKNKLLMDILEQDDSDSEKSNSILSISKNSISEKKSKPKKTSTIERDLKIVARYLELIKTKPHLIVMRNLEKEVVELGITKSQKHQIRRILTENNIEF